MNWDFVKKALSGTDWEGCLYGDPPNWTTVYSQSFFCIVGQVVSSARLRLAELGLENVVTKMLSRTRPPAITLSFHNNPPACQFYLSFGVRVKRGKQSKLL